jgi:hypothetical protein
MKEIVEPPGDLLYIEHPDFCRGQLDRQWDTIQSVADLGDKGRVLVCNRKIGDG